MRNIQVVEPTLEGYSGHCHSLVSSFCRAAAGASIALWSARGSEVLEFGPGVAVHPWFRRRVRLPQALLLFRRLLRHPDPIVVMTARRSDLILINWVAARPLPPNRVFLYFHWFRDTPGKSRFLQKMAARLPNLVILGTTASVVEAFRRCGFANVYLVTYPATRPAHAAPPLPFRQLLYAGAARQDKGFAQVVDLVERLARKKESVPITIQISADHYGKYDPATRADLARLRAIGYAPLKLVGETLSPADYAALFPGSICLQPYRRADFVDRVSGVTLDALAHGCPVVATSGTWMAGLISRFGAGLALDDISAEGLHGAIGAVMGRYASYQAAARAAGLAQDRNSWAPLIDLLDQ
jgi:glycosyltransferase involved in cell wall biosynthesis